RAAAADLHLLPSGAAVRVQGRAHAAHPRRLEHRRDRQGVPHRRADDGPAAGPRQAEDLRGRDPVPRAAPGSAAGTAERRPRGALPDLQRRLRRAGRATGPHGRGDSSRPHAGPPDADRARGPRAAGADAPERGPAPGAYRRRRAGHAGASGPVRLGPQDDRRRHRRPRPGAAPAESRAVPGPSRDRRLPRDRARRGRHGLAADRGALRRARPAGPSPVVDLNRAVAVGMADGIPSGLALLDDLARSGRLDGYHLLPAARADLLRRAGRTDEAGDAYREALELAPTEAERRYLTGRLREL